MAPLILHSVPEDELYVGEDGIRRPYALLFPGIDGNNSNVRSRRTAPETGSFGKSTRHSKSRTGTPAVKREDPTLTAANAIFSNYFAEKAAENSSVSQRPSLISTGSQSNVIGGQHDRNSMTASSSRFPKQRHKQPTEVILRGFKSSQQYAAIREYERIAGQICEDYPRDPPAEQRKFKTDLRDHISMRPEPLTPEEKAKALKFAGGEHWIKVTFTSAENAETAIECSPLRIFGHYIYAELYRGVPPSDDQEIFIDDANSISGRYDLCDDHSLESVSGINDARHFEGNNQPTRSKSLFSLPSTSTDHENGLLSPADSQGSTLTYISRTYDSETSPTITGSASALLSGGEFCQRIPTARKMRLLSADRALLPQKSPFQKFLSSLPVIGWVSKDLIGGVVPRTEQGEFDYKNASLYWKLMWFIEKYTGITIVGDPKDD
ncbi:Nucleoporin [Podosphaera aphanis]|nr:Nucleoporin [Podosphaera aphanis]